MPIHVCTPKTGCDAISTITKSIKNSRFLPNKEHLSLQIPTGTIVDPPKAQKQSISFWYALFYFSYQNGDTIQVAKC
jgi:hypothetical protein